jgi:hypothetical protein
MAEMIPVHGRLEREQSTMENLFDIGRLCRENLASPINP